MSIVVTCIIKLAEHKYEMDSQDMDVFVETAWTGSTGTFAESPKFIIQGLIEAATERAQRGASKKLAVIKGGQDDSVD